jgi:FkbM family methyltransferase
MLLSHKDYSITFPEVPEITERIRSSITLGHYERYEARAALALVGNGCSVLELGGGAGFLSALLSRHKKLTGYTLVEADPRMIQVIEKTHVLNGVHGVTVIHAIATSNTAETAKFAMAHNFTASSANKLGIGRKEVDVPTVSLSTLIADTNPTVIICDIEGGEADLMKDADLSRVKAVIMELHPPVIGLAGVRTVFDQMHTAGLTYNCATSFGDVVSFVRS